MHQPGFANARSVRNELESARLRHAHRLASDLDRRWTRDDLMRLEAADILATHPGLQVEHSQAVDLPAVSSSPAASPKFSVSGGR